MKNINNIIWIIIFGFVLIGGGYYIYNNVIISNNTTQDIAVTEGGSDISSIPVPDLDRMVIDKNSLSEEVALILEQKIRGLSDELKLDSDNLSAWLDLGIWRKTGGDYEGAVAAWDYAGKIRPENSISFNNLGDLYAYYLKDPQKAEENFLKAIENGPYEIYLYFKMHDFYRDVMKDTAKARAIVERGLESNPDSTELQDLLNSI